MAKISELNLVGNLVESDQLLALRSGANVRVEAGSLTPDYSASANGQVFTSNGTTTAPEWKDINTPLSVGDYGAVGDGAADDTTSIQNTISSTYGNAEAVGDTITMPRGVFKTSATIEIDNTAQSFNVDDITLKGAGRQSTIIDATNQTSGAGINIFHGIYNHIADLSVLYAAGTGITLDAGNPQNSGNRNHFERIQSSLNGEHGFEFQNSYLGKVSGCNAERNAVDGFHSNHQVHTSYLLEQNYGRLNGTVSGAGFATGAGFKSEYGVYTSYLANAGDLNRYGYHILGNRGVSFVSNGAEFNARAGFFFETENHPTIPARRFEANWVSGISNVGADNNKENGGWANHTHVKSSDITTNFVVQKQPVSLYASVPNTYDFICSGRGARLVLEDPLMYNSGTRAYTGGFIQTNYTAPQLYYQKNFTQSVAIALTSLGSSLGTNNDFSGELLITAYNSEFGTTGVIGTATYKLLVSKSLAGEQVVTLATAGLTTGASSSHPSFTWSLSSGNLLATPYSTTSGNFWFAIEKVAGNLIFT